MKGGLADEGARLDYPVLLFRTWHLPAAIGRATDRSVRPVEHLGLGRVIGGVLPDTGHIARAAHPHTQAVALGHTRPAAGIQRRGLDIESGARGGWTAVLHHA